MEEAIRIYEWAWLWQRGVWCSEAEGKEEANVAGTGFCEHLWSHWLWPAMTKCKCWDTENIQAKARESLSRMHGHLALLREFHLLVWKTVNSTHSPQISLRQRGSTPPRINSFCSLRLSLSFLIFPVALRWGFIWLAFTLGFLLGLWFSTVSRELLTYLVSGSVLDISVVWNYSSRSKNGVCAIVNLMTEWRNIIFFICGGIFFSFKWGPNVKGYWTGTVFMDRCI